MAPIRGYLLTSPTTAAPRLGVETGLRAGEMLGLRVSELATVEFPHKCREGVGCGTL